MLCDRCFRKMHEEENGAIISLKHQDAEKPNDTWVICADCSCDVESFLSVMYRYLTIPETENIKAARGGFNEKK